MNHRTVCNAPICRSDVQPISIYRIQARTLVLALLPSLSHNFRRILNSAKSVASAKIFFSTSTDAVCAVCPGHRP